MIGIIANNGIKSQKEISRIIDLRLESCISDPLTVKEKTTPTLPLTNPQKPKAITADGSENPIAMPTLINDKADKPKQAKERILNIVIIFNSPLTIELKR